MKKICKRTMVAFLVFLTVFMAFSCSKDNDSTTTTTATASTTSTTKATTKNEKPRKLTVAIQNTSYVSDYDDNYLTNYLEDKLDMEIEFYALPSAAEDVRTNVSLLATSSRDLPDVLMTANALTAETILYYGSSGVFLALDDYINDPVKMPNYNAIPAVDKKIMENAQQMADGHTYSLSSYEPETWNLTPNRMFINKAWLDKLGLDIPTTTDELEKVLIAFRDNDPNGNGYKDEIGVYGYQTGSYGQNVIAAIMNSFEFWNAGIQNGGLALSEDGNTVIAPFTQNGWKEGLKYMNKLYKEGVLSPAIFTDSDTQFRATLNEETNAVGLTSIGSLGNYPSAATNKNFLEMQLIEPLYGPEGKRYTPYYIYSPGQNAAVFADSENIDLAIEFLDAFYAEDVSTIVRFGKEGEDWTRDPDFLSTQTNAYIAEGIYDSPDIAYISNQWLETTNKTWHGVSIRYVSQDGMNKTANALAPFDPDDPTQLVAKNYRYYTDKHPEYVLPLLHYTVDEVDQIQDAITNIPTYVEQATAEFITGAMDIDSGWNSYISNLNSMGLNEWLSKAQVAYDRSR